MHFSEGIAGYVKGKGVLRYRPKLEISHNSLVKMGLMQTSKRPIVYHHTW